MDDATIEEIHARQTKSFNTVWAVCHCNECPNQGIPIVSVCDFDPPIVYCGPCGSHIEDISPFSQ